MRNLSNLVIAIAYFSIPIQILVSLCRYPGLSSMSLRIVTLLILFALFIFLCGLCHLFQFLGRADTFQFEVLSCLTAVVSLATTLYLLPLVPNLMEAISNGLRDIAQLEETNEAKRKLKTFMAFLCHEIRNPLFAITSNLTFLEDDDLTESQASALRSIKESSDLMMRIVNDVLDVSKLESGKLQLECVNFELHKLINGLSKSFELIIQQKYRGKVNFKLNIEDSVPEVVSTDFVRILQIAYNLLSNASKFTEEGEVEFVVRTCPWDEAVRRRRIQPESFDHVGVKDKNNDSVSTCSTGDLTLADSWSNLLEEGDPHVSSATTNYDFAVLVLEVKDTGVGIPAERVKTVFEPYCQSKISTFRKYGGTGLGLSIMKKVVDLMSGSIELASKEGHGTTFSVYLPVKVPRDAKVALEHEGVNLKAAGSRVSCPDLSPEPEELLSRRNSSTPLLLAFEREDSKNKPLWCEGKTADQRIFPLMREDAGSLPEVDLPLHMGRSFATSNETVQETSSSSMVIGSKNDNTKVYDLPVASVAPTNDTVQETSSGIVTASKKDNSLVAFNFAPNTVRVLVVDDNDINRKILGRMLTHFNLEFESAVNGKEAVNMVLNRRSRDGTPPYQLILMDMSMPIMNGIEAIQILRKNEIDTPIIALTANALDVHRVEALQAGATEFCTKPIIRTVLYQKCVDYLR